MSLDDRNIWLKRGAWLSLIASVVVLGVKYYAYRVTGSISVLSDALESIINVVTAALALWVIGYISEPADAEHPYGHGKMEYFSAAFEGGLISFASLAIAYEAIRGLIEGNVPKQLDLGVYLTVGATSINFVVAALLLWIAKTKKSEALEASGKHIMSDVVTSVGAVAGLALVGLTGLGWMDPAVALLISGNLAFSGYKVVRRSIGALIDEVDISVVNEFSKALKLSSPKEAIDYHQVRFIRSGHFHHVDAHLVLPEFWSVEKSHHFATDVENRIRDNYPYDLEVAFHVDPCLRKYCSFCELSDCSIRTKDFVQKREWTAKELIVGEPVHES